MQGTFFFYTCIIFSNHTQKHWVTELQYVYGKYTEIKHIHKSDPQSIHQITEKKDMMTIFQTIL